MAGRRRAFLATLLGASALAAAPVSAAVGERLPQPILLSDSTMSWVAGQDRWVTLSWTAQADIDDVEVAVIPSDSSVAITYENPAIGHAELSDGPALSANEIDATTFLLDPSASTSEEFDLELYVDWSYRGEAHSGTMRVRVHQAEAGDEPFLLLTDGARVPARGDGAHNWVSLSFLGLRPSIERFSVSVEGELPIYYPQTSFTSLHHDAVLLEDERDVARFWIDPSTIEPGDYQLDVVVSYTINGGPLQTTNAPLRVRVD